MHQPYIRLGPFTDILPNCQVILPGSKSLSNRALLLGALSQERVVIDNVLLAEDTIMMLNALETLGVDVMVSVAGQEHLWRPSLIKNHFESMSYVDFAEKMTGGLSGVLSSIALTCYIQGCGASFPVSDATLWLGNAGTAFRPLTAVLALQRGHFFLDGVERMRERPIKDLVEALRQLGAQIEYTGELGFPPLRIEPLNFQAQPEIWVKGDTSSQFISAILMALPTVPKASLQSIVLRIDGELISKPYVLMTLKLMESFGVYVNYSIDLDRFSIEMGQVYRAPKKSPTAPAGYWSVEGDASSASYFLAMGALSTQKINVLGVGSASLQGDVAFVEHLKSMGVTVHIRQHQIEVVGQQRLPNHFAFLNPLNIDCSDIPDAAMTYAVLALFAKGRTTLRGIGTWRVKETDRILAMQTELRKLGARVTSTDHSITIDPPGLGDWRSPPEGIDTYNDHRMAMCFSLASFGPHPVQINNPHCVAKTFPSYFEIFMRCVNQAPV